MAVVHQLADLDRSRGWPGVPDLRPERARLFELGVNHRLADAVRVSATMYDRRERDGLRPPDVLPRLVEGGLTGPGPRRFENALTGSARGMEVLVAGRSRTGVAGWASYAYGVARYRDVDRGEAFRADFDQRHAVSVSASAPLGPTTRLGLTFRGGSGTPVPGYFVVRDRRLFAGEQRNLAQLPAYARLDVRAERTLRVAGRTVTLFADVVNLLDRSNDAPNGGGVIRESGEAVGVVDRLFPRLFGGGLRLEF
jgi:outer membrane receptor protein involved in Fe transport